MASEASGDMQSFDRLSALGPCGYFPHVSFEPGGDGAARRVRQPDLAEVLKGVKQLDPAPSAVDAREEC